MLAIYSGIKYIRNCHQHNDYVIFTDLLSSVKCLIKYENKSDLKSKIISVAGNHNGEIASV